MGLAVQTHDVHPTSVYEKGGLAMDVTVVCLKTADLNPNSL
jgi:hypothetical protein